MYDLFVDGLREIKAALPFRTEKFSFQGLIGYASGSATVFRFPHRPLLSSETTVIYHDGEAVSSASYTLDTESGVVRFSTAPAQGTQVEATYYRCDYSDTVLKQILFSAFRRMEMLWRRGLRLSSGSSTYAEATTDSEHAYVVSATTMTDPTITGTTTFSSSHAQRGLLMALAELVRMETEAHQAALTAFSYREDRGMAIDRSRVPSNIAEMIRLQEDVVSRALVEAQMEVYGAEIPGGFLSRDLSEDYDYNFAVWDDDDDDTTALV